MRLRRKKKIEEHENHERWLVSYADFITLLFAFFVVMYSISSVNVGKYRVMSDSIGSAFTGGNLVKAVNGKIDDSSVIKNLPDQSRQAELLMRERRALAKIAASLQRVLDPLVKSGKVKVTNSSLGVSVEINSSVLFSAGAAQLSAESTHIVEALALVLRGESNLIQIEGHTDSVPIATELFASNWELSAGRASAVARVLSGRGVLESRMTVVGHGANKPVVPNDTADGRMRNRRVIVMILPKREAPGVVLSR